jgi:cobalamin synthase
MLPIAVLVFVQAWARGAIPFWVAIAIFALAASSPVALTPAIRATERETEKPDYRQLTSEEMRARERRAAYALVAVLCLVMPAVGYVIDGLAIAAVFLVLAMLSSVVALWSHRRFWGD